MSDAMWGISEAALRGLMTGLALGALVSVILIVKAAYKFLRRNFAARWRQEPGSVAPVAPAPPPPEDGMMDIASPARPAKSHDVLVTALIIGVLLGLVVLRDIYR
jgi:hypothetical protein